MLYFIVLASEVGIGKDQRLQDCCPGVGTRDSARQIKRGSKTQQGQEAQHTFAAG